jgi:arsenate reductase
MDKKSKVLFLCRGDASRGLIAEGFLQALAGDHFIVSSAGTEAATVSPLAIEVMSELGIDISNQKPNGIASLFRKTYHCVVALCDERQERYPLYPFTRNVLRWSVADPEATTEGPEERKRAYRRVRDQLRNRVEEFIQTMKPQDRSLAKTNAAAA